MAKQKYTEAKKNSNLKWDTANLDRMSLALPKGSREAIKTHATAQGESTNAFIKRAIDNQISQDRDKAPSEALQATSGGMAVSLPSDTIKAAQEAAQNAGETVSRFIERAVDTQAKRDKSSLALGIDPATGGKLEKEA